MEAFGVRPTPIHCFIRWKDTYSTRTRLALVINHPSGTDKSSCLNILYYTSALRLKVHAPTQLMNARELHRLSLEREELTLLFGDHPRIGTCVEALE